MRIDPSIISPLMYSWRMAHTTTPERKSLWLYIVLCFTLFFATLPTEQANAQLVSVEDVQYTPVNTPVEYRWYSSSSGFQYWYISRGQGTINTNTSYTNAYQAQVTWTATGSSQLTYVTSSGQYKVDVNVVACRPVPGATASNYLSAGSFDACRETRTFNVNTAVSCYLDDYYYTSANNTGNPRAQPSPDVYYRFHLSRPSQVTVSTCGSGFDTYLHLVSLATNQVWDDDDSGNNAAVSCGGNSSYLSSISASANATTLPAALPPVLPVGDYFIIAEGWGSNVGALQLSLTVAPEFNPTVSITTTPQIQPGNIVEIIRGNSATLTAAGDGVDTFSWVVTSTGAAAGTGANLVVSPLITTTYTVTGRGCTNSRTATATVTVQVALTNRNYITTRTIQVPGKVTEQDVLGQSPVNVAASTVYFDGLGRPIQTVNWAGSPVQQRDLVQPISYDAMGRASTAYLPYTQDINSGVFKSGALSQQSSFYQVTTAPSRLAKDASPVAVTVYEPSPLNRVLEQGAPGAAWQPGTGHTVRYTQRSNGAGEVRQWQYSFSTATCSSSQTYAPGELIVKETRDEDNNLTTEYADKQGRTILKKVAAVAGSPTDANSLLTYYIYDDFNNLRLVISPQGYKELIASGSWSLSADFVHLWCFRYNYDARQRVIEKQTPGTTEDVSAGNGLTSMVYNKWNQVVLTQDGNQAKRNEWSFTKYDGLSRPIYTGFITISGKTRSDLQGDLDSETVLAESRDNSLAGYTLTATYPRSITENNLLTITYYDDYSYAKLTDPSATRFASSLPATSLADGVRGLVTAMNYRRLEPSGPVLTSWLTTVTYYDSQYRVLETVGDTHLGNNSITRQRNTYDFVRLKSSTVEQTTAAGVRHTISNEFEYDNAGRLVTTYQNTNNQGKIILSQNEYNEVGQLVAKKLHQPIGATRFLQKVDYRYNIRGWLTHINNRDLNNNNIEQSPGVYVADNSDLAVADPDLFGFELRYNEMLHAGAQPSFNGNIAQAMWQTRSPNTRNNLLRSYTYTYDAANRIKDAQYTTYENGIWAKNQTDFSTTGITYDGNGNLLSMSRQGTVNGDDVNPVKGTLDQLTYTYEGTINGKLVKSNQLLAVDDAAPANTASHDFKDNSHSYAQTGQIEYAYDTNGNLTSDLNKGISSIVYTRLNQPAMINFANNNRIEYSYTATGAKLQKRVYTAGTLSGKTDYAGPFVYELDQPVFAQTSEGRVLYLPNTNAPLPWKYEYQLKDHLGNLRFAFRADRDNNAATQRQASMEASNAEQEEQQFSHVAETRLADPAHARSGNYVARLNARTGRRNGPSIRLQVAAGDSVHAEVYGRYDRSGSGTSLLRSTTLAVGSTANIFSEKPGKENSLPNASRHKRIPVLGFSLAVAPQLLKVKPAAVPAAFLRYELFTRDSQLVATRTQAIQRTSFDKWQHLEAGTTADSAGFVVISLINESGEAAYFDDLKVNSVAPTPFQENHFDPFGLNLVGIEQADQPNSAFQYNGNEKQDNFGLNWTDYGHRMYDAQLGRFHTQDWYADSTRSWSSYHYAANNPLRFIDIMGDSAWSVHRQWDATDNKRFADFAYKRAQEYMDKGTKIDCADLAMSILVEYASSNGLPLELKSGDGKTTFNSNSDEFTSTSQFKTAVKTGLGAKDIGANTFEVPKPQRHVGDLIILTSPAKHIALINSTNKNAPNALIYGNLRGGQPTVPEATTDWSDYTSIRNSNTTMQYLGGTKVVHRWNVFKQNTKK
jgi:RHS repeat-associated protein